MPPPFEQVKLKQAKETRKIEKYLSITFIS
jgi:hypothetical protein